MYSPDGEPGTPELGRKSRSPRVRPLSGRPPSRREAVESAVGRARDGLGHRFRRGEARGRSATHAVGRLGRHATLHAAGAVQRCVDARGDVYSLGITLYELLAGRPAFPKTTPQHVITPITQVGPPRLAQGHPDVPADLETIVLKAIAREPERRYQPPRSYGDDLRRFLDDPPANPGSPTAQSSGPGAGAGGTRHRPRRSVTVFC